MNQEEFKIEQARKRIKDLKGFYTHLSVYILVNVFILAASTHVFTKISLNEYAVWGYLSTPLFWGIGLTIHAIFVFVPSFGFIKQWEERKMKELMGKDSNNFKY